MMKTKSGSRKGERYNATTLPFPINVYINNQVLIPASLVRALGITHLAYANIVIEYNNFTIEIKKAKLLRTKHTDSRQFTIPRHIRETYGIGPGDIIKIVAVKPIREASTQGTQ